MPDTPPSDTRRAYEMTLVSVHANEDNEMLGVECQLRRGDDPPEPFILSEHNSAFLNFLFCLFTCQLAYLRMNAAERGLEIDRVRGTFDAVADAFVLERVVASFVMELRRGEPSEDDLAYIAERCMACPVSRNLGHLKEKETRVSVAARET